LVSLAQISIVPTLHSVADVGESVGSTFLSISNTGEVTIDNGSGGAGGGTEAAP
jgi:hypothetical protein